MADNFDLRQFLTENKLTKNAQLLNEARVEGFDVNKKAFKVSFINKYGGEGDFRILNAETPEQAEEVFTNIFVKNPDMVKSINSIEPYQVPAPKPQAQPQPGLEGVDYGSIEIDGVDSNDYPDFVDAYVAYAEFEDGTPLSEEELYQLTDELYQSGELADRAAESLYEGKEKDTLDEVYINFVPGRVYASKNGKLTYITVVPPGGSYKGQKNPTQENLYLFADESGKKGFGFTIEQIKQARMDPMSTRGDFGNLPNANIVTLDGTQGLLDMIANATVKRTVSGPELKEAKSYKVSKNSKEAQHLKKGDIIGSGDEVVSVSAGAKTPSGKVEVTLKTKDGKTKTSTWGKTTKVGLKAKETVKENTMTQRDKYLTRLVENALGLDPDEMEDYPEGEELQNRIDRNIDQAMYRGEAEREVGLGEGEDMVQEKPLPKYENIEKLMQEIEHGTNEAACKYKMDEMKRVYEALEKKVSSLEEGEHAEYTDKKAINQMRKDIAALRKAEEKLRKDFDKKFNKEKKEAPKKEKEEVTLAEGNFDLRKFLTENKLTASSRMLKEYIESDPETITQAFSQAGVDLSAPTEVEAYYGHDGEDLKFVTGQEALAYLEDFRTEAENEDPNFNTEAGITFDYGENIADLYEGDGTPKLAVNFGDSAMYIIAQ